MRVVSCCLFFSGWKNAKFSQKKQRKGISFHIKIDIYTHTHRNTRKTLFVVVVADLMRKKERKTMNDGRRRRAEKGEPDRRMIKIIK